jgi:hypothetical protein
VRKELAPAPEFDRQDLLNVRGAAKLSGLSKNHRQTGGSTVRDASEPHQTAAGGLSDLVEAAHPA